MFGQSTRHHTLARQARDACKRNPELCEYLAERDRALLRMVQEAPDPNDLELSANYNPARHLERARSATIRDSTASRQADQVRSTYPELHTYLAQRDARLERAISLATCDEDAELCAVHHPRVRLEQILRDLGPGIAEIAG